MRLLRMRIRSNTKRYQVYGQTCPAAAPIIHLGATSAYVAVRFSPLSFHPFLGRKMNSEVGQCRLDLSPRWTRYTAEEASGVYSQIVSLRTTIPGPALPRIHSWYGSFWVKGGTKLILNRTACATDYIGYAAMEISLQ